MNEQEPCLSLKKLALFAPRSRIQASVLRSTSGCATRFAQSWSCSAARNCAQADARGSATRATASSTPRCGFQDLRARRRARAPCPVRMQTRTWSLPHPGRKVSCTGRTSHSWYTAIHGNYSTFSPSKTLCMAKSRGWGPSTRAGARPRATRWWIQMMNE